MNVSNIRSSSGRGSTHNKGALVTMVLKQIFHSRPRIGVVQLSRDGSSCRRFELEVLLLKKKKKKTGAAKSESFNVCDSVVYVSSRSVFGQSCGVFAVSYWPRCVARFSEFFTATNITSLPKSTTLAK